MTQRSFTAGMWSDAARIRNAVDQHPFVSGLFDGTLPRRAFDHYIAQDAHYLTGYAVALQTCAAHADSSRSAAFWSEAARDTVAIEQALHDGYLQGRTVPDRSAPCSSYVTFLLETAGAVSAAGAAAPVSAAGGPVLAAAVLPCFWIFSDLGRPSAAVDVDGHPYADWLATYRDPRFAAATDQARAIVDDLAARTTSSVRSAMQDAFRSACRYELALFDDAWDCRGGRPDGAALPDRGSRSASSSATTNDASDADNHG
jgi:thiaminase/transcriptional activator TenA